MFNLALSLFTSFGFFDDMNENQAVVTNLYSSLAGNEMDEKNEEIAHVRIVTREERMPDSGLI